MKIFKELNRRGHEQVAFFNDPYSGLKGIVAIHNTTLGPALGGCRMWKYKTEQEAVIDVLRLSKGMTYKASIAGLNLGGNEIYPSLFQPFGGFPDSSIVENSYVTFPKFIGMGYEKKEKLNTLFKRLFN